MTLEEYNDWKEHPVTKDITETFTLLREEMIQDMSNGITIGDNTGENTAMLVGKIAGLNYFINRHHEDME